MGKYNYKLAKWLSKKLKPLSVNEHTISDIFLSADELQEMEINEHDLLVFMMYLQSSLMFLWMKSSRALPKEPLKITGSAIRTQSQHHEVGFANCHQTSFSLKEICTNRWMVMLWVCFWDLSQQTPSCVMRRNNWKQKTRCWKSTNAMLMICLA